MIHTSPAPKAMAVLLVATLACGLPASPPSSGGTAIPAEGTPTSATGPVGAATPASGADALSAEVLQEPEPPPPAGFVDSIAKGVESGTWTYEEGLISALRVLVGEVDMGTTFGDVAPAEAEATGVILDGYHYLRVGGDPQARAEIERLLSLLVPDIDRLIEYSRPDTGTSGRVPGLAAVRKDDEQCAELYQKGFPPGSSLTCFVLITTAMGPNDSRVLYPESWTTGDPRFEYAYASGQAIVDAYKVYLPWGVMQDVDLVFTLLDYSGPESAAAIVESKSVNPTCTIIVFPLALTGTIPKFKQVIAHEMFHCFQQWNWPDHFPQSNEDFSWAVQDWWGEGTADYFSNVVYPSVNLEWNTLGAFAARSAEESLVTMSYENSVFFQFLANQGSPTDVLELVNTLPAGGSEADQATALAAYPGIANLFHQFARDYVDKKIADTNPGTTVPTGYLPVPQKFRIPIGPGDHTVALLSAPAFTLTRYVLQFKPERVYNLATAESGVPGLYGSRLLIGSGWNPLPAAVSAGCGEVPYYVLMTSAGDGAGDPYTIGVTADVTQETKCDACLIGSWDLNKDSFIGYMSTPFLKTPGLFEPIDAQGIWRYTFDKTGTLGAQFNYAFDYILHQTGVGPLDTEVMLTFKGPATSLYWIPEEGLLMMQGVESGVHMGQFVWLNGQEVESGGDTLSDSMPASGLNPVPSAGDIASATYACLPNKLILTLTGAAQAGLPAIEFDRASGP